MEQLCVATSFSLGYAPVCGMYQGLVSARGVLLQCISW